METLASRSATDLYVVTASHLFSIPYSHEVFKAGLGDHHLPGGIDFAVDLKVNNVLIEKAARVAARDILADIAVLAIEPEKYGELACAMGVSAVGDIQGLEMAESLEQLRALENGVKIRVVEVKHLSVGVDTPADAEAIQKLLDALIKSQR
jgi:hypothetical protein